MTISIQELQAGTLHDVNRCSGLFTVNSKLCLEVKDEKIYYSIQKIPEYEKRYGIDKIYYASYIQNPDKAVYLAYMDNQVAGHIILRKNWNQYCYVEDIVVDEKFRKNGIGRMLMTKAIEWAKAKKLPGIMLETQNNNVGACLFYQRCGFQLEGFGRSLYLGINKGTEETALYWYLRFDQSSMGKNSASPNPRLRTCR